MNQLLSFQGNKLTFVSQALFPLRVLLCRDYVFCAGGSVSESISCSAREILLHNLIPSQDYIKENATGHKCLHNFSNQAELTS